MLLDKHEQEQETELTELKRAVSDLQQKVMLLQPLEAHAVDIDGALSDGTSSVSGDVVLKGTITITPPEPFSPNAFFTVTQAHGLGYTPLASGQVLTPVNTFLTEWANKRYTLPFMPGSGGEVSIALRIRVDDTNVIAEFHNAYSANQVGWGGPYTVQYWLIAP